MNIDAASVHVTPELLGRGRLGSTYLGECRSQEIAVKVISYERDDDEHTMKKALQEALQNAKNIVAHKNVVAYLGVADDVRHSRFLLLSPVASRGSLRRVLHERDRPLSFPRRMKMAEGILNGLRWLHHSGMNHGEVSSSNVLVDDDWHPKLTGYGMSASSLSATLPRSRSSLEESVGDVAYTSPECLLQGESYRDTPAADIWAYGVLLWELSTQQRPWVATCHSVGDVFVALKRGDRLPIPSDTFAGLTQMIEWCWQEDPQERPTAEQLFRSGSRSGDDEQFGIGTINRAIVFKELGFDPLGMRVWNGLLGLDEVPWHLFAQAVADTLGIAYDDEDVKWRMLYHLVTSNSDRALLSAWKRALLWFGPLHPEQFFQKLVTTAAHQWFHGNISRDEADEAVTTHAKPGSYLVRFSSQPGCYTITALKKKKKEWVVENYRIARKDEGLTINGQDCFADLAALIAKHKKDLGLKFVCPGSKYVYQQLRPLDQSRDDLFFEDNE